MASRLPSLSLKFVEMTTKLFLLLNLGANRFAVETDCITEIVPIVEMIKVPKTEAFICGLMNYRGETLSVIDTVRLLYDVDYNKKMCSRIIIISITENNKTTRIGLIAEKVNRTRRIDTNVISEHALTLEHTPYLGKIISDQEGDIQIINQERLIKHESRHLITQIPGPGKTHTEITI